MLDPVSSRLASASSCPGPLVLVYHAICSGRSRSPWSVSLEDFRWQMDFLHSRGWQTRPVQDTCGPAADRRNIAITFDDGYEDNLQALDVLARHGQSATWFIVTGSLGERARWATNPDEQLPILNPTQLRELTAAGMDIGSHTVSHPHLPALDDETLATELQDSRHQLEDLLAAPVQGFAYPYGEYDPRVCATARRVYDYACTTDPGTATASADPHSIRRITIFGQDSRASFARKLAFADNEAGWGDTFRYLSRRIRERVRSA